MLKNILSLLSLISFVFLLSACAGLPPDKPLCTELSLDRGYCVKMMSGESFEVSDTKPYQGKTWWEMRPTMIRMPLETWVDLKKWIIKICKNNSQCDSAVSNWERTVNKIDEAISSP